MFSLQSNYRQADRMLISTGVAYLQLTAKFTKKFNKIKTRPVFIESDYQRVFTGFTD